LAVAISFNLPEKLSAHYYLLHLNFIDDQNYQFTEKTYRLWSANTTSINNKDLVSKVVRKSGIIENNNSFSATFGSAQFTVDKKQGDAMIAGLSTKQTLLEGPLARVGRKNNLSSIATNTRKDTSSAMFNWFPHILGNPVSKVEKVSTNAIRCKYKYERIDKRGDFIEGSVIYTVSDSGWINVDYNFVPVHASGVFLEAGLSFKVPVAFSELRWIGNGPYPAFPGKSTPEKNIRVWRFYQPQR
jgi:beta-galactosidase